MKRVRRRIFLLLILMNLIGQNFLYYSNAYEDLPIFSLNKFYLNYIVYTNKITINETSYNRNENDPMNLDNLGLFLNFSKMTESEYKCHLKYNFLNFTFEGDLIFNILDYTFHSFTDINRKMHLPIFNPPNIKKLKNFPFMTFQRDEPSIIYFEDSSDYDNPEWDTSVIDTLDQDRVHCYVITPKHPVSGNEVGLYKYEAANHFLVSGQFYYASLSILLELSNPENSDLVIGIFLQCTLIETDLPFELYEPNPLRNTDIGLLIIIVILGIAGIGSILFMKKRRKMMKKSWKKRKKF